MMFDPPPLNSPPSALNILIFPQQKSINYETRKICQPQDSREPEMSNRQMDRQADTTLTQKHQRPNPSLLLWPIFVILNQGSNPPPFIPKFYLEKTGATKLIS